MAAADTAVETVTYLVEQGVALITFNRPERNNAMTRRMQSDYFDALDRADADPYVRAIVVTGAGKSFCVGADMDDLADIDPSRPHTTWKDQDQRIVSHAVSIPKPVVAAINGPCAGLGLVHALFCDVRFAASGIKMTTSFARRGLIAEHGISWILPRLVGPSCALDLVLSARVVLAEEAKELGVVNQVAPPEGLLEEALAYARDLAVHCSPKSMAAMKRQLYADYHNTLEDATAKANELMQDSFTWPDIKEGVASWVEKREPRFPPLS